jgi:glycosyltransferase involved in cell wall biosynthesis
VYETGDADASDSSDWPGWFAALPLPVDPIANRVMENMARPSVRVVIPCFNYGRFVREAVESAFAQEDAEVEVVVVDDGSDDGETAETCASCRDLGATVIHQENRGLPAARNRGAAGATTEYLVFLDADDLLLPGFTRDLAGAIRAEAEAGRGDDVSHAYGQQQVTGLVEMTWEVPSWDPILEMITNLHPPTALVRRSVFEQTGGFHEDMVEGYEDWDYWIRCIACGFRGVRVALPVYVWRRHSEETLLRSALRSHQKLFQRIVTRYEGLYREHALELVTRMNSMLHEAGASWLDASLEPIHLRDLRRQLASLATERDDAGRRAILAEEEIRSLRAAYEAKPVIRLSRAVHQFIEGLPQPIGAPLLGVLGLLRKLAPPAR